MQAAVESSAARAEPDASVNLERDAWVVLLSVSGLGPVSFGALLAAFGSARAVLDSATAPDGPARLLAALADAAADADEVPEAGVFDACAVTTGAQASEPGAGNPTSSRRRPAIGADLAARICDAAAGGARPVEQVRALGLTVVTLEEPGYPARLRQVELPPPLLFVQGSVAALAARDAVAVVGTRRPTDKGRLIAGWIGSAIARTGAVLVSGLAVGIDGAAHAAVVAEGGRTVAVLGGGHARLFPRAHERLADAIVVAGGAVVSELTPDTNPSRGTFPRRNRLVSGLSDATVVVEAGRRSGALITAGWALEQGRECFLVPGPFDSPTSAGCHAFLRSFPGQARVVSGIAELIEDLGLDGGVESASRVEIDTGVGTAAEAASATLSGAGKRRRSGPSSATPGLGHAAVLASLGPVERDLAHELAKGPATADQLAVRTSLTCAAVLSALTLLELRGLVTSAYGRYSPSGSLASWPESPQRRPA
ncbi:MAG: DNA-processing protein DprA [Candidatus Limnocylindrales bacterium]